MILFNVLHRIDDLERTQFEKQSDPLVLHRIDDLEKSNERLEMSLGVLHRIDDLEILRSEHKRYK